MSEDPVIILNPGPHTLVIVHYDKSLKKPVKKEFQSIAELQKYADGLKKSS